MLSVFSNSILLFISTVIQYWTTDYLKKVLLADPQVVLILFVIICITAPTIGILVGGCIVSKLGGYDSKNAPLLVSLFSIISFGVSLPIAVVSNVYVFAVILWIFLFFGGAMLPNLIGISLSALPIEIRATGNSYTNIFNNIFGFIPAPFLYGIIFDWTKKRHPSFAYGICMWYSSVTSVLMGIAGLIRRAEFAKKEKEAAEATDNKLNLDKDKSAVPININNNSENLDIVEMSEIKVQVDNVNIQEENIPNHEVGPSKTDKSFKNKIAGLEAKQSFELKSKKTFNKPQDFKEKAIQNCLTMNELNYKIFDQIDAKKFNSDGQNGKITKLKTNIKDLKDEDILFKGQNGKHDIFEIKFKKINQDEYEMHQGDNNEDINDNFYSDDRNNK